MVEDWVVIGASAEKESSALSNVDAWPSWGAASSAPTDYNSKRAGDALAGEASLAYIDRDESSVVTKAAASRRTPKWGE